MRENVAPRSHYDLMEHVVLHLATRYHRPLELQEIGDAARIRLCASAAFRFS